MKLKDYYWIYLSSFSLRYKIITKLLPGSRILDVGCGSCLPQKSKSYNKSIYYIGLDINNYLKSEQSKIDEYIICPPSEFAENISNIQEGANLDDYFTYNLYPGDDIGSGAERLIKKLPSNVTLIGTSANYLFSKCIGLLEVPPFDFTGVTNFNYAF